MISVALILPATYREAGDALSVALGHDVGVGQTYSVGLSPDGSDPATHYGCRTWATPEFAASIIAAQAGNPPAVAGVSAEQVSALIAHLMWSQRPYGEHAGHFDALAAQHGLQRLVSASVLES